MSVQMKALTGDAMEDLDQIRKSAAPRRARLAHLLRRRDCHKCRGRPSPIFEYFPLSPGLVCTSGSARCCPAFDADVRGAQTCDAHTCNAHTCDAQTFDAETSDAPAR